MCSPLCTCVRACACVTCCKHAHGFPFSCNQTVLVAMVCLSFSGRRGHGLTAGLASTLAAELARRARIADHRRPSAARIHFRRQLRASAFVRVLQPLFPLIRLFSPRVASWRHEPHPVITPHTTHMRAHTHISRPPRHTHIHTHTRTHAVDEFDSSTHCSPGTRLHASSFLARYGRESWPRF